MKKLLGTNKCNGKNNNLLKKALDRTKPPKKWDISKKSYLLYISLLVAFINFLYIPASQVLVKTLLEHIADDALPIPANSKWALPALKINIEAAELGTCTAKFLIPKSIFILSWLLVEILIEACKAS